jgi:hypothetical protein
MAAQRSCNWQLRATSSESDLNLSTGCRGAPLQPGTKLPIPGAEEIMSQKAHGAWITFRLEYTRHISTPFLLVLVQLHAVGDLAYG